MFTPRHTKQQASACLQDLNGELQHPLVGLHRNPQLLPAELRTGLEASMKCKPRKLLLSLQIPSITVRTCEVLRRSSKVRDKNSQEHFPNSHGTRHLESDIHHHRNSA